MKADEVYRAGLELDVEERAVVAHRLLASLHTDVEGAPQHGVDDAWLDEIGTRVDDILNGGVETRTFAQTRAKARALLDDLRQ